MANPFTEIREAIEALFEDGIGTLVARVLKFNEEVGISYDDPALQITKWLRVDPLGGPVDPYDTSSRWKFTRKYQVLFNLPVGNMDVGQLEEIEAAICGLVAAGVAVNLNLSYVSAVRWTGGEYSLFFRKKDQREELSEGQEMWVGIGQMEVDFKALRSDVAAWAPS